VTSHCARVCTPWTDAEKEYLRLNADKKADTLAREMGRTAHAIRSMKKTMRLGRQWVKEEMLVEVRRLHAQGLGDRDIAEALHIGKWTAAKYRNELRLPPKKGGAKGTGRRERTHNRQECLEKHADLKARIKLYSKRAAKGLPLFS
jgi:hypothetical protein